MSDPLRIYFHRDFDGMVSAALLASILRGRGEADVSWSSVNYDQRRDWERFGEGERFAIVDFHFHPRAEYWFDHHPTTFLSAELRERYQPSERWRWDETSPSCPPLVIAHAREHWAWQPEERFLEMARWSDVIDAALYENVEQAVFGDQAALRVSRALTAAPSNAWVDELVGAMSTQSIEAVASLSKVEKAFQRASRNRDKALEQFPPTVDSMEERVLLYDASSNAIRRERFAPFYHYPDIHYAVGVIPTRSGFHVSCGRNPWNAPPVDAIHVGQIMERYGGGGHRAVGGAHPPDLQAARKAAAEIAAELRAALHGRV